MPLTVTKLKRAEAGSRLRDIRRARGTTIARARVQRQNALVGNARKWKITNWEESFAAYAKA